MWWILEFLMTQRPRWLNLALVVAVLAAAVACVAVASAVFPWAIW